MNPKIEKVTREIEKTRARIADDQARLKELERQKTDFENTEIVVLFRSVDVEPAELAAFIEKYKKESAGDFTRNTHYPAAASYTPAPEESEDSIDE